MYPPHTRMQCAAAVDNLAGYYFKHMPGSESPTPAAAVSERARQLTLPPLCYSGPPSCYPVSPHLDMDIMHCPAPAVAFPRPCRQLPHRILRCHCLPQAIGEHLRQRPELLPQILSTLFEIVLFEDCTNQWSLSRPMLRWVGAPHCHLDAVRRTGAVHWLL
jgi:hypothetical protein